ncbi:MAG: undecaprenyl-diphosphate phosphatase [Clostridiales bacterium]|nr:undecaprenyl-diphosphate phosphatase [Clostridiales bacterium]
MTKRTEYGILQDVHPSIPGPEILPATGSSSKGATNMNAIQAALLGLVQGIGEFLPISSSGHLLLGRMVLGLNIDQTSGAYHMLDILLHVGTLIPVLIVFWKDWWEILKNPFKSKTLLLLFIASLPTLVVKFIFDDFIDGANTGWFLGVSFLMTAVFLLVAEQVSAKKKQRADKPGFLHAIVMGCMQGIALLPGVSRSGSTLAGGLLSGLERKSAAKFSFMMSAPAIAGALLLEGKDAIENGWFRDLQVLPTLLGVVVAGVSGYLAIRFMLKLISRVSLNWFALYVAILGVAFLVLQLLGFPGVPDFAPPAQEAAALLSACLIA